MVSKLKSDYEYLLAVRERNTLSRIANDFVDGPKKVKDLNNQISDYELFKKDYLRPGTWIPTLSGRRLFLLDPKPEEFTLYDIAMGMSKISRYNGMTESINPYVVGQHLVYCKRHVKDKRFELHAFAHDFQEFAAMDITRPIKNILGQNYETFENRLKDCVAEKYNIKWTKEAEQIVKEVDNTLLTTEVEDLQVCGTANYHQRRLPIKIKPWGNRKVFNEFVKTAKELGLHVNTNKYLD